MRAENRPLTSVRGFAALWVVAHHWIIAELGVAPLFLQFGYTAVDLFFVLSGLILAEVYASLRWRAVPAFFLKRACRIYPMQFVTLSAFVLPAIWHWSRAHDLPRILNWQTVESYLLLQAYVPLSVPANPPAWSAGVELTCYLLFPPAILLLRRTRHRWGLLGLLGVALLLEHAVLVRWIGAIHGTGAVLRGMAGFALGMVLWRVARDMQPGRLAASLAELAGCCGIAVAIAVNRPDLIPLWAALLLLGLRFDAGVVAGALRTRPCVWLGRISFSVYLVHYPLVVYADRLLPARVFPGGSLVAGAERLAILTPVLLALCTLTYRFIEEPGRRLPGLLLRRRPAAARRAVAAG